LDCLNNGDLLLFSDIVTDAELNDSAEKNGAKLPADHWINKPLDEADGRTLLMVAVEKDAKDFVSVLLRAGADAQLAANQEPIL
jgi:hypothetical protein